MTKKIEAIKNELEGMEQVALFGRWGVKVSAVDAFIANLVWSHVTYFGHDKAGNSVVRDNNGVYYKYNVQNAEA